MILEVIKFAVMITACDRFGVCCEQFTACCNRFTKHQFAVKLSAIKYYYNMRTCSNCNEVELHAAVIEMTI